MMPPRGNNRGGYVDSDIDRLTTLGRLTTERARRTEIYRAVQKRLAITLPMIPLWWAPTVVVKTRRLRGFKPRADGSLESLREAWLEPEGSG